MLLKNLNQNKDFIEVAETYPFAIRNILQEAGGINITRHTGQTVPLHVDLELTVMEQVGAIHTSNVEAPMTEWHMHTKYDSFAWIARQAEILATTISKKLAPLELKTNECWGIHYEKETQTKRHSHFPYLFAFGYYVNNDAKAPINFPTANYSYNPVPGDLIVFPGWVQHEVKSVEGKRIMIAGNILNTRWSSPK